jgi:hypothetical protein
MLAERVERLEARLSRRWEAALRLLTDAELDRVLEFAENWNGDAAHIEAVFAAWPGTREAVARLAKLGGGL